MFVKSKMRLAAASLALPIVFLAGCGGGNGGLTTNPTATPTTTGTPTPTATATAAPANVASATVIGLTSTNSLVRFNTRTPGTVTSLSLAGLAAGEHLLGIDYRFAPSTGGSTGLYGLSRRSDGTLQLYRIEFNGDAASLRAIGSGFAAPNVTSAGFDFNPNVINATTGVRGDAIRIVSPSRDNLRVNADTGQLADGDPNAGGQQNDGILIFAAGDANQGASPQLVGAAYTNNDSDAATGTTLFAIDATTGSLVTQGRAASGNNAAVSPNTGQLFTVGSLGVTVGDANNVGFDIAPGNNTAFASFSGAGTRLYTIDLGSGRATLVGSVGMSGPATLVGLAIVP